MVLLNSVVHYSNCPVCGSAQFIDIFKVKDYTVSGEEFQIVECPACFLRFTQDVPSPDAIGRYYKSENYISHTNTSAGLVNRIYQLVRKRTLANKRKLITQLTGLKTGQLLDIGSGTGSFVAEMSRHGWQVTGLEPDADARKNARELYGVELGEMNEFYKTREQSFDAISLWHVLEHVHELHPYVKRLKHLLKPGGTIFIAVPNYTSDDAIKYGPYWAAYDVPRHLYHFSPGSIEKLMQAHGLKITSLRQMWYDSFYISLLSSKYKHGHTNYLEAGWNGLRSNMKAIGNADKCSSVMYIVTHK